MRKALEKLIPDGKQRFAANFKSLEADLLALDRKIEVQVQDKQAQPLVEFHPVYDYFAGRYRPRIRSVLWEPDQHSPDRQWNALKELLKMHPVNWMIWEGNRRLQTVDRLKALGVDSLVFDSCSSAPAEADFLGVMARNVANL